MALSLLALVVFGVALLAAAWLIRAPGRAPSSLDLLIQVTAWSLISASVVIVCLLATMVVGGIIGWLISCVVLAVVFNRIRQVRQDELLSVIATCVEREIPLEPVLAGLAQEYRGLSRRRVRRLVQLLQHGMWLPDALARVPNVVPWRAVAAARVGATTGQFAQALRDAADARSRSLAHYNFVASRVGLIIWTSIVAVVVCSYYLWFIAPKMAQIIGDFGLPSTALVQNLAGSAFATLLGLALPLVGMVILGIALILFLVYLGWLRPILPLGPLWRRVEAGSLMRNLALIAESKTPVSQGLSVLSESYPQFTLRRGLRKAAELTASGMPLSDALLHSRLTSGSNAALIQAAEQVGNLPWSLRVLADNTDRRLLYWLQAAAQICFPICLLFLGAIVAMMALSVFVPLVQFILQSVP